MQGGERQCRNSSAAVKGCALDPRRAWLLARGLTGKGALRGLRE